VPTDRRRRRFLQSALAAGASVAAGCSRAEVEYPGREVRIIVHAAPGGLSDTVARYTARGLNAVFGVPVVCENRVGAMGAVAFAVVRRSEADGYTLGYAPVDLSIVPHMGYTDITADDFDLLVMHHRAPAVLVVQADSPWTSVNDLLSAARLRARSMSLATAGPASVWQIAAFSLARRADVSFIYVPFPGSGPAITALLGSHIDAVVAGVPEVQAVVRAGAVRALAVMSDARSPIFPDVPTFREQGLDLQFEAWGGFMAPKGVPPERRALISRSIQQAFQATDFLQYCRTAGLDLHVLDTPTFERFMESESTRFSRIVREEGLVRG
jgi:tripartite-type tricarboxylate transporter receptor subunit TctC